MARWPLRWFPLVCAAVVLADSTALLPSSSEPPLLALRAFFATLLICFLPGLCLVKLLYPRAQLSGAELLLYSVVASLLLSGLTVIGLGLSPWGFGTVQNPGPTLLGLSAMTLALGSMASYREKSRG